MIFLINACIRSDYKRSASSFANYFITARRSYEARGACAATSIGTGSREGSLSFIASACPTLSTTSCLGVSISAFLYIVRNKGFVALCGMRSGLVFIGGKIDLLLVDCVVLLFLILSSFVSDAELICGSAFVAELSSMSGEFYTAKKWTLL